MRAPPTSTTGIRVLTVDDSERFRTTARQLLEATDGFVPVGEADCGERGIELAVELQPDLVLMDVHMPGIGGVEAARRIHDLRSAVVVLVSIRRAEELPAPAWTCGASAILLKDRLGPRLLTRLWQRIAAERPERPLVGAEL